VHQAHHHPGRRSENAMSVVPDQATVTAPGISAAPSKHG
jgi:hypothetical protein